MPPHFRGNLSIPAPWPEDFFDPNSGWHDPQKTQPSAIPDNEEPPF